MSNQQIKINLKAAIKEHCEEEGSYYREVDDRRILIRCPFCGDSTNPRHAHLYIVLNIENNYNPGYICHKCGEHGAVNEDFLTMLDIANPNLKAELHVLNKTSERRSHNGYTEETKMEYFDYKIPMIRRGSKTAYLEERLGRSFSDQELKDCKVITSLYDFMTQNQIPENEYRYPAWQMNILERDYLGFLTYGNSHILLRDITNTHDLSWLKYPITLQSAENNVIYTLAAELDPLSPKPIIINICEGVMDIVSVCYNLGYDKPGTLNVCITGNHYEKFILFLINLGLVGSNITINIFADNDAVFNPKAKRKTTLPYFQKVFRKAKYLFGSIYVYYNVIGKDCGVPRDKIRLQKNRI